MKLGVILWGLYQIYVLKALETTHLTEEYWADFKWKEDDVLDRFDEQFEEDFIRAHAEYLGSEHMPEARRNAARYRFGVLDTIRGRNRYIFLTAIEKHLLTSKDIRIVPEEDVFGPDPEEEEIKKWEKFYKYSYEDKLRDPNRFTMKELPSFGDESVTRIFPTPEDSFHESTLYDNNHEGYPKIEEYTGDFSEFEKGGHVLKKDL